MSGYLSLLNTIFFPGTQMVSPPQNEAFALVHNLSRSFQEVKQYLEVSFALLIKSGLLVFVPLVSQQ